MQTNMCNYTRIYVAQLGSHSVKHAYWYIGRTDCLPAQRHDAHMGNRYGADWCKMHGYLGMRICCRVLEHHANTLENDLTKWFMATFGWRRVRGGDYVKTEADPDDLWWLPLEFRQNKKGTISFRNVLKLRLGAMTKFPSELRGLVDSFLASGRPQHPYQLNTDTFPKPFLC